VGIEVVHLAHEVQGLGVLPEIGRGGLHEEEHQRGQEDGGAERHQRPAMYLNMAASRFLLAGCRIASDSAHATSHVL
jgi:hypothetical protein